MIQVTSTVPYFMGELPSLHHDDKGNDVDGSEGATISDSGSISPPIFDNQGKRDLRTLDAFPHAVTIAGHMGPHPSCRWNSPLTHSSCLLCNPEKIILKKIGSI
jgi:hypothetical protein